MKNTILSLAVILFSSNAMSLGNDKYYKVLHLYSWTNGEAHVWLDKNGGEHACPNQKYSTRYLISRQNSKEFDQKFSLLLAAKTSGQPVKMEYTCDKNGVPWISAIRF